jgi:hypothetical protein
LTRARGRARVCVCVGGWWWWWVGGIWAIYWRAQAKQCCCKPMALKEANRPLPSLTTVHEARAGCQLCLGVACVSCRGPSFKGRAASWGHRAPAALHIGAELGGGNVEEQVAVRAVTVHSLTSCIGAGIPRGAGAAGGRRIWDDGRCRCNAPLPVRARMLQMAWHGPDAWCKWGVQDGGA